ncbi:MAG TPA: Tol-Pal system protein TolB [Chlamydiales bacterium]|nr:Tol-Pal system protein TolB [Chlamydiales bacterium]
MLKFIHLFLLPFFLFGNELEVQLPTRANLTPIYLSRIHTDPSQYDWRYFDELRNILAFDFNTSGYFFVAEKRDGLEESLHFPEVRADFNLALWKKEKIPYVLAIEVSQNRFYLTAFNVEKGTSKKYPDFPLSGQVDEDRKSIHRLTDLLQKDFIGMEGIASLRIIHTQRVRKPDSKVLDWISEVWICDADGGNVQQITSEKSYCLSPAFLPRSLSFEDPAFYYVSYKTGQPKIYRASFSHPEGEPMVSLRGNQALPALTQKGNQMAFITDVAGRPDLFIQNFDPGGRMLGKARQLFSSPRASQASPTYSPDGKKIAFVSDKEGPPRIYLLEVTGPKETKRAIPRLLTKKNRENTSPVWSPDGMKLAFSAKVDGIRQIWIYDFATEEETQLTTGPENKENPSWAPNSLHLVYNTESEDTCELYLINLNNPVPMQISNGLGQKRFATWESYPKERSVLRGPQEESVRNPR